MVWTKEIGLLKNNVIGFITHLLLQQPEHFIEAEWGTYELLDKRDLYFYNKEGQCYNMKYDCSVEDLCHHADDLVAAQECDTTEAP